MTSMSNRTGGGGAGGEGGAAGESNIGAKAVGGHPPDADGPSEENADDDTAHSELLAPLLEEWRDVLVTHVLSRLDPTDCALLAQVGKPWLEVPLANNLPRAGKGGAMPLKLVDFVGSVHSLAWAKDNGCSWEEGTCALVAARGHLDVLRWAREHGCDRDGETCSYAAANGHLEVLQWARANHCPWEAGPWENGPWGEEGEGEYDEDNPTNCCLLAARGGHLDVLQWARAHGCPWEGFLVWEAAARNGHLALLPGCCGSNGAVDGGRVHTPLLAGTWT